MARARTDDLPRHAEPAPVAAGGRAGAADRAGEVERAEEGASRR